MKNRKMSLGLKLGITMTALLIGTILIGLIINNVFLEKYYLYNKEKQMVSAYETIDLACIRGIFEDDSFDVTFDRICSNNNLNVIVTDPYRVWVVRSSVREDRLQQQINRLNETESNGTYTIIKENSKYILAYQSDETMGEEFIVLFGNLSDDNFIYMRTPIQSIKESADLTNYFFEMVGFGSLIVGVIVIFLLARSITKPIKRLTDISDRMARLDFDAKYDEPGGSREVHELGIHMNELSYRLENTFSELKTANNELVKDIAKKEEIDEMRKEFLSNVSHELKTPIALIQGYAEGLVEGISDDPESRDFYCNVIMDEADKMNKMVRKLLTLNQLEFGNDMVEMIRFDLNEVVRGVVNSSQLMAEQKNISIEYDEAEPVYVWADEFKVEEVVTNYLSNAINHAQGEKQIKIWVTRTEDRIRLSVYNTGDVIPEEELDKIWIKFYKVDKARTREYGGSGIGLSIVKAIMESMNQQCGVINHDKGVEFWMELDAKSIQM